jgi:group I intron endonuclease
MHVYLIQNTVNGKCYVGQHAGEDLEKYWQFNVKKALANKGNKTFLYRAIRKYGPENFTIRTIHVPIDAAGMTNAEIAYIKFFGTQNEELGYNITAGGPGRLGTKCSEHNKKLYSELYTGKKTKPHTDEAKVKMAAACKGRVFSEEHKLNISKAKSGKPLGTKSKEHREKLSTSLKGRKFSEETRARMSAARLGKKLVGGKYVTSGERESHGPCGPCTQGL